MKDRSLNWQHQFNIPNKQTFRLLHLLLNSHSILINTQS